MSRKRKEINPLRAERLKTIIRKEKEKDKKFTQSEFAKRVGFSQQNISRIINLQNSLTEEAAQRIVSVFPGYRIAWLLGYDDYMTEAERFSDMIRTANEEGDLLHNGFMSFAMLSGFKIDVAPVTDGTTAEKALQSIKEYCTISRDGRSVTFSISELNAFENELCDYIEFRLLHLMK